MRIGIPYRYSRFWSAYFIVRLLYLVFTIFVYSRMTVLGDTARYLSAPVAFSPSVFWNSTALMDFLGGILGHALGGNNLLSNFPAMLASFLAVRWSVDKLGLRRSTNNILLFVLISLPNFCIWSSVFSKEVFGVIFSAILGVLLVHFLRGDFRLRRRDLFGFYLCFLFKPQYLPFILQGLILIRLCALLRRNVAAQLGVCIAAVGLNVAAMVAVSDTVNRYAEVMPIHFISYEAGSNRNGDIWKGDNAVFKKAPYGMLTAFVGPTPAEMRQKPANLVAGAEGLFIIGLFLWLAAGMALRFVAAGRFSPAVVFAVFIIFTGIAFMNYPFGIFNPGAAIRYRTNFIYLFILLLLYLHESYPVLNGRLSTRTAVPDRFPIDSGLESN